MKRKPSRYQRALWIISLLVVLSMGISLFVSFTPRTPRVTPTPTWTPVAVLER